MVLGKMSRSSLASVVFPLDEQPLMATITAFWLSIAAAVHRPHAWRSFDGLGACARV